MQKSTINKKKIIKIHAHKNQQLINKTLKEDNGCRLRACTAHV